MPGFDVRTLTDISDLIASWEAQFVSETSYRRYVRAAAWTTDESVKSMAPGMRSGTPQVLDRPSPWTVRAFQYTRSLGKARTSQDGVSSDMFVMDDQSIVVKYLLGSGTNVRLPGDVGLARSHVYLPNADALLKTRGVRMNKYGNLPDGTAASIVRDAENGRKSTPGRWGVYKGTLNVGGSPVMGYIARPARVVDPRGGATIFNGARGQRIANKTINLGRPRVLLAAVDRVTYRPVLQLLWDRLQREAIRRIPDLMAAELADGVAYRQGQARLR